MKYEIRLKSGRKIILDKKEPLIQNNNDGIEFCSDAAVLSWKELPVASDLKMVVGSFEGEV